MAYHVRRIAVVLQLAMAVLPVGWTGLANDMMSIILGLLEVFPNPGGHGRQKNLA